jgi:hypothetical protein
MLFEWGKQDVHIHFWQGNTTEIGYLKIQAGNWREVVCENMNWFRTISVHTSDPILLIFLNEYNTHKNRKCYKGG